MEKCGAKLDIFVFISTSQPCKVDLQRVLHVYYMVE